MLEGHFFNALTFCIIVAHVFDNRGHILKQRVASNKVSMFLDNRAFFAAKGVLRRWRHVSFAGRTSHFSIWKLTFSDAKAFEERRAAASGRDPHPNPRMKKEYANQIVPHCPIGG